MHRGSPRGAETQQMPIRRRAPQGCRLSGLQYAMLVQHTISKPENRQQKVKLFLRSPLAQACLLVRQPAPPSCRRRRHPAVPQQELLGINS
jgi:hypothetical protein